MVEPSLDLPVCSYITAPRFPTALSLLPYLFLYLCGQLFLPVSKCISKSAVAGTAPGVRSDSNHLVLENLYQRLVCVDTYQLFVKCFSSISSFEL